MLTTPEADSGAPPLSRLHGVAVLAILSVAAGFLHAAVIDSHRGHGIAAGVFAAIAVLQIAWAAFAMARPSRAVLTAGALGNAAIVAGYLLHRTSGIAFLDGFQESEPVGFTDGVTTALEVVLVAGSLWLLSAAPERRVWPAGRLGTAGLGLAGLAVAAIGVPAASEAGSFHEHGQFSSAAPALHGDEADLAATTDESDTGHGGHGGHGEATEVDASAAASSAEHDAIHEAHNGEASTATPEQEAAAAKLLADTKSGFWQWTDPDRAYAAGFRTINDGGTGTEHLIQWSWIDDEVVLDPNFPESLVFRVTPSGEKVLEAAMFMVAPNTPDSELPDVGGPLTQWHIHDDLCMSPEAMVDGFVQRSVVGLVSPDGSCAAGENLPDAQMLHVWVVERECGPFSSLEGIGAGQAVDEEVDPNAKVECQHSEH